MSALNDELLGMAGLWKEKINIARRCLMQGVIANIISMELGEAANKSLH